MNAVLHPVRLVPLCAGVLALSGCATHPGTAGTELCGELTTFIAAEAKSGGGQVTVGRQGAWLVNHSKSCQKRDGDNAAVSFCAYLMDHTSTEFMEATVNTVMACLQGQKLLGYTGNTGISQWDGHAHFYAPRVNVSGAEVDLSWHLTSFGEWNDHVTFSVEAER